LGKHSAKRRKTGYLRVFFLWSLVISLLVGAAGFVYARFLEERIHYGSEAVAQDEDNFESGARGDGETANFLLLGSDTRDKKGDVGRSDTIMVFRMNPKEKIAYLISIPRDSRVTIPGHGKQKINAAYQYGGPGLMIKTVERFTGLDIDHYAVVDFQGFKDIVDALGGIDIDVEKRLTDKRNLKMDLRPGYQHLDGQAALDYCRIRSCDDDFGRMERQQKFLKAVMDKLFRLSTVIRIPQLADIASRNIKTDPGLGITQMIAYGQDARQIGRSNIHMLTLPGTPKTIDKVSYVILDEDKVEWLLDRIKNDLPLELTDEEKKNENILVEVQNGSGKPGIAHEMANKLNDLRFKTGEVKNAESFNYYETQIIALKEKEELARRVQTQLGFGRVITDEEVPEGADVLVIVGRDFAYVVSEGYENQ